MRILCTGAAGYIGGSVANRLMQSGHHVIGLVRSQKRADQVRRLGIEPLMGSLDDLEVLQQAALEADAVINAASADHEGAVSAFTWALEGSGKPFIHTSGSSVVGTQTGGHRVDDIYDEETPFKPSSGRAARAALNERILASKERGFRPIIVCPSLIYGLGHGATEHSMQVPWLIDVARKHGIAKHFGPGENIWSNVHIDDLIDLYARALDHAPAGSFYFAENGENSMRELCEAINTMLGFTGQPQAMTLAEAADEWGENGAKNTMGSNSRVRAKRAGPELGWSPQAQSLIDEILHGCYRIPTT